MRPRAARQKQVLLAAFLWRAAGKATVLSNNGLHEYMTEATAHCYKQLLADPMCCKDQRVAPAVRQKDIVRSGAAWTCGGIGTPNECIDEGKGERGSDAFWWPQDADCSTPRILYVHGGGWQRHGPREASYDVFGAYLAQVSGSTVLVPDYPLVPVGNYEAILGYLVAAWGWLSQHGPDGEDCSRAPVPPMFVAGDSSGAASALSLLLMFLDRGDLPTPAGFLGFSPWINLACDSPTYYSNAFSLVEDTNGKDIVGDILFRGAPHNISNSLRELALKYFAGAESRLRDAQFSPFYASEVHLARLPPAYIAVSGTEVLAGDSIIFAQRAAEHGARVYLDIFPGMWHGFQQYLEGCGSGGELWQASTALSHAADFVVQITKYLRNSRGRPLPPSSERSPRTNTYYPHPEGKKPWVFVGELNLALAVPSEARMPLPTPASFLAPGHQVRSTAGGVGSASEPQLSMVAPRALPADNVIGCPGGTLVGAVMAGLLCGMISTLAMVVATSWYLTRRANRELPLWFPDFLKHPVDNFYAEDRQPKAGLK